MKSESLLLLPPIERPTILHRARFHLSIETAAEQVFQGQHRAAANQRHAIADIEFRRQIFAETDHRAAEGARLADASVVEAEFGAELRGEDAAAGRQCSGRGGDLVGFVAAGVAEAATQHLGNVAAQSGLTLASAAMRLLAAFIASTTSNALYWITP